MMLLIQTMKWFGPGRENKRRDEVLITNELTTYATSQSLSDALSALRAYDRGFAEHFRITAVEHTLVGVQVVDELSEEDLDNARIWTVEALTASLAAIIADEQEGVS